MEGLSCSFTVPLPLCATYFELIQIAGVGVGGISIILRLLLQIVVRNTDPSFKYVNLTFIAL